MQRLPHLPRHFAVQCGDRVAALRHLQAKNRHAERLVPIVDIFAAECHEVVVRKSELLTQRLKVLFDKVSAKPVVPGGNRRVRGEHDLAANMR